MTLAGTLHEDMNRYRVAQKERVFLKSVVVGIVKVDDLPTPPENSSDGISSVAMQQWNVEHRCFGVNIIFFYIENKQSYNYSKNMRSFCATLYNNICLGS